MLVEAPMGRPPPPRAFFAQPARRVIEKKRPKVIVGALSDALPAPSRRRARRSRARGRPRDARRRDVRQPRPREQLRRSVRAAARLRTKAASCASGAVCDRARRAFRPNGRHAAVRGRRRSARAFAHWPAAARTDPRKGSTDATTKAAAGLIGMRSGSSTRSSTLSSATTSNGPAPAASAPPDTRTDQPDGRLRGQRRCRAATARSSRRLSCAWLATNIVDKNDWAGWRAQGKIGRPQLDMALLRRPGRCLTSSRFVNTVLNFGQLRLARLHAATARART